LHCLFDCSGQIQLGEATFMDVSKDGKDQAPAFGRDAQNRAAWLAEEEAGDVRAVE
jgi:hypothetical protein